MVSSERVLLLERKGVVSRLLVVTDVHLVAEGKRSYCAQLVHQRRIILLRKFRSEQRFMLVGLRLDGLALLFAYLSFRRLETVRPGHLRAASRQHLRLFCMKGASTIEDGFSAVSKEHTALVRLQEGKIRSHW